MLSTRDVAARSGILPRFARCRHVWPLCLSLLCEPVSHGEDAKRIESPGTIQVEGVQEPLLGNRGRLTEVAPDRSTNGRITDRTIEEILRSTSLHHSPTRSIDQPHPSGDPA